MRRAFLVFVTVVLAAVASIPVTSAAPPERSGKAWHAEGTWSFTTTEWVEWRKTHNGTSFVTGSEDGTWTGTFKGASVDDFGAKLRSNGSLEAMLQITFTGTVAGKSGTLEIATTAFVPFFHPQRPMTGDWYIVSGTGGLANLHGQGSWVMPLNEDHIVYEGIVKFL
jgi:hypothetical protein